MKKLLVILCVLVSATSCSKKDESFPFEFHFLHKHAVVSGTGGTEITFEAYPFDTNESVWEIKVYDDDENETAAQISPFDGSVVRVVTTVSPLPVGDYHLVIRNKVTGQTHLEAFKVVADNSMIEGVYGYDAPLANMVSGYYPDYEHSRYLFFGGNTYGFEIDDNLNEVSTIRFMRYDGSDEFALDFEQPSYRNLTFFMPSNVIEGLYYVAVEFNHVQSDRVYYPYLVGISHAAPPEITGINKTSFTEDETVILTGKNFNGPINEMFRLDDWWEPSLFFGVYMHDETTNYKGYLYNYSETSIYVVNETGTQLTFPAKLLLNDSRKKDFDGTISVRTYAARSNLYTIHVTDKE